MRAARVHGRNRPLVLDDVPVPDIRRDELLVPVKAAVLFDES
jgi:hypothetical protein